MTPTAALLLGWLLTVAVPSAAEIQKDDCVVFWSFRSDTSRGTEFCITEADARRIPAWNPEKEDPPLGVARATEIGRAHAKNMRPKWDDAAILRIEMAPLHIGADGPPWKWYYNLSLAPILDEELYARGDFHLIVLMDGTVLEGRPAKRER